MNDNILKAIGYSDDEIRLQNIANITGRIARCCDCGQETPSNLNLPFFQYQPSAKHDRYYCGCHGWE